MITSQVNRFTLQNKWSKNFFRFSHNDKTKVLYPLKSRSLVKVSGHDAAQFLQGLITNDMNHFEDGARSMYAMFLNNKGRVLYDTIIHKWGSDNNIFMLECDKSVHHLLQRHLNIYKLKRSIKIGDVSQLFQVWALITPAPTDLDEFSETDHRYNINVYKDPRIADLGYRLITTTDVGRFDLQYAIGKDTVVKNAEDEYQALRYRLGVSEGAEDLFPGSSFPLEANCDYLHGISFHKGCYIGQEVTARIHHTGVVRKRIMPIRFLELNRKDQPQKDAEIWGNIEPGKTKVGKLKNHVDVFGLGLVRIKEALEAKALNIGVNRVQIIKPYWWPIEAPKEKLIVLKPLRNAAPVEKENSPVFKPEYETIQEK